MPLKQTIRQLIEPAQLVKFKYNRQHVNTSLAINASSEI